MKDLNPKEIYDLRGITEEQAKEVYEWLLKNEPRWHPSGHSSMFNNSTIHYNLGRWYFSSRTDTTTHISTLFEEKSLEQELQEAETKVAELKKQIEERDKPKKGDVCKFYDSEEENYVISKLMEIDNTHHLSYISNRGFRWCKAKKLTQQEVIDLLFGK